MIDEKTIAKWEQDAIDAGLRGYAEAFRNARRYLALRENGVYIDEQGDILIYEEQLDAAADRLLEGGE